MRAQLRTQAIGMDTTGISKDKISLSLYTKYLKTSESYTGFPGGKTYMFFSNSTLHKSLVNFSEKTYSNQI